MATAAIATPPPYRRCSNSESVVIPNRRNRGKNVTALIAASMLPVQAINSSAAPPE